MTPTPFDLLFREIAPVRRVFRPQAVASGTSGLDFEIGEGQFEVYQSTDLAHWYLAAWVNSHGEDGQEDWVWITRVRTKNGVTGDTNRIYNPPDNVIRSLKFVQYNNAAALDATTWAQGIVDAPEIANPMPPPPMLLRKDLYGFHAHTRDAATSIPLT